MKLLLRNKWIDALLNGKYKQIQSRLGNKSDGRCCLGVLCNVAKIDFVSTVSSDCAGDGNINSKVYTRMIRLLGNSKTKFHLMGMNDCRKSFKEIATWIKRYL